MRFDILNVLAEPLDHGLLLAFVDLPLHFVQSKVNDIVVMNFHSRKFVAQLKPELVQKINLFRGEARRMGAKVKDLLLA